MIELSALLAAGLIFVSSYYFYDSKDGRLSIYKSWYAPLIDILAMVGGLYVVMISIFLYRENWSWLVVTPLLIVGIVISMMHTAKFFVRKKFDK